jgi:folylpolyglutamate synthase
MSNNKGKGSTCALLESILREGNLKTGLFTSPHLVDVRERIRINGKLLPQDVFEEYVMDTYRLLGPERMATIGFFQFLTLTTFRIFAKTTVKRQDIDVLVLEVGIGGRLDYTNAIDSPICCAITRLDLDHTELLGPTISLIAAEKAGIAKPGVTLYTPTTQAPDGLDVIRSVCEQQGAPLVLVPPLCDQKLRLGIGGGEHQLENAAIASALARHVFAKLKPSTQISEYVYTKGLENCRFPGRAQIERNSDGLTFYMDGAHTPLSVEKASKWFNLVTPKNEKKILVFHCSPDRDGRKLLQIIKADNADISLALFLPPSTGVNAGGPSYHEELASIWQSLGKECKAIVLKVDPLAVKRLLSEMHQADSLQHVFVVGSFYIVGDALKYWVDWSAEKAFSTTDT